MFSEQDSPSGISASSPSFTNDNPEDSVVQPLSSSATPYDDAFRTMMQYCSELLIPVINEIFGTEYTPDAKIDFTPNEHLIRGSAGTLNRKITDSVFSITWQKLYIRYILECQSNPDHTIVLRIFEYSTNEALNHYSFSEDMLTITYPRTAILYLRSTRNTPSSFTIKIKGTQGVAMLDVPVMKLSDYSLKDIFDKKLYFLLPFYLFNHEKSLKEADIDPDAYQQIMSLLNDLTRDIDRSVKQEELTYYQESVILHMLHLVSQALAKNSPVTRKEVDRLMRGKVIHIEFADKYLAAKEEGREEGREEGISEGLELGQLLSIRQLLSHTKWPVEQVMDALGIEPSKRQKYLSLL